MKKYKVVSSKAVTVRVGDQKESTIKTLNKNEVFETSEAFAADLLAIGAVKLAEEKLAAEGTKTAKAGTVKTTKEVK